MLRSLISTLLSFNKKNPFNICISSDWFIQMLYSPQSLDSIIMKEVLIQLLLAARLSFLTI
jgi:hypothetical protein